MLTRTVARPVAIAAAACVTLILGLVAARPVAAQFLPTVLYGAGLAPGQKVEAFIDGKSCASTTASPKGEWVMQIPVDAPCGPKPDAAITFTLDGKPVTATPAATWQSGGIPTASIRTGYSLTASGSGSAGTTQDTADTTDGGSGSAVLFIALGVVLLAAGGVGLYFYRRNSAT